MVSLWRRFSGGNPRRKVHRLEKYVSMNDNSDRIDEHEESRKEELPPHEASEAHPSGNTNPVRARIRSLTESPFFSVFFFPCVLLYHELMLRICDRDIVFFSPALARIVLFSLAAGLFVFLILDLIPCKRVSRLAGGVLIFAFSAVLCVERGMRSLFSIYYGVLSAANVAGNAMGDFADDIVSAVVRLIPFILFALLPLALFILTRRSVLRDRKTARPGDAGTDAQADGPAGEAPLYGPALRAETGAQADGPAPRKRSRIWLMRGLVLITLAAAQFLGVSMARAGEAQAAYTYDFTTNGAIPEFGLFTGIRLEFQYALFGMPEADMSSFIEEPAGTAAGNASGAPSGQPEMPLESLSGTTQETSPAAGPEDLSGQTGPSPEDTPSAAEATADQSANPASGTSSAQAGPSPENTPYAGGTTADQSANPAPGTSSAQAGPSPESAPSAGGTSPGSMPSAAGTSPETTPSASGITHEKPGLLADSGENRIVPAAEPSESVVYGFNQLDIDFAALAENTSDKTLKSMHEYFGSLTPSQQNEYTGMFAGKNLILLTAESFSPYVISEELTPTLYRLTHEAFVFNNFYQPDWTQSTVGGEFSVTTGIIPNWINSTVAARAAIGHSMPMTLGNMFRSLGYATPAWHNGSYDYYDRNQYLETFGYDYKGENGGGLDLPYDGWPRSDLEMIQYTCDSYIDACVQDGVPFHAYYMTISGHGSWGWDKNRQSSKYRELVEAAYPDLSEPCQAYIACHIELDKALEYLVRKLEDAGLADDTLIVMASDHYPYFLGNGNNVPGDTTDYYNELTGLNDSELVTSRYRNTLLMWSGCIRSPIVVDTPCSTIDIVPTVANLFGLSYDSRLYSGRDIFARNYNAGEYSNCMPLVVFMSNKGQGNSWITAAGTYEAGTGIFTPNAGITVDGEYVSRVQRLVAGKIQNARLILTQNYYAEVFN